MPKDLKEQDQDVEVIDDEPEEDGSKPSDVTVDLDKPSEPAKKEEPKAEPQRQPAVDLSKLHNTIAFQTRKFEQAMREIQSLRDELHKATTPEKVSEIKDEIDEIAQRDWKAGVKKVVETQINEAVSAALKKRDEETQAVNKRYSIERELETSKAKVLQKYPKIEESGSEESQLYISVINEDTSLLSNTHGPEIAMYRMEEKMRAMGRIPPTVQPAVDKEVSRLVRAGASSVVGRKASPNGKITLTREQKEFCDHNNIPYENYAKNLKADEARGGVEA